MANRNRKEKSKLIRVDPEFDREMRNLAKERYMKDLEKKEPSTSEMTRLLRRTLGYKEAQFELKSKPRKENL